MAASVYYHGTIEQFVPSILAEGLSPNHTENRWDATKEGSTYNPKFDPEGYVYVLDYSTKAVEYAVAKANYFKAHPGEWFDGPNGMRLQKALETPVIPDARPAVLKILIPETLRDRIEPDSKDPDALALKVEIPPFVISVDDIARARCRRRSRESKERTLQIEMDDMRRMFSRTLVLRMISEILESEEN